MKGLYSTILLLAIAGYSYGQNLFLKTQGHSATVCGDNISFTIEVRNLSSTQTLTNIIVKSKFKTGITFDSETSTPSIHQVASLPDHPSFAVGTMAPSTARFITFTAKTDCNLVTYLNDNNVTDGLINNTTTATYNNGTTALTAEEPDGSESYNIFYPVLTLRVNEADKTKAATGSEQVTRQLTITNTGNGSLQLNNIFLEITREAGLTFVSATGAGATSTTAGSLTTVRFTDFSTVGNHDNMLDPNESFTVTETVQVNSCSDLALTSNYFAKWGCLNAVCNLNSNNSQDASLVQVTAGGSPVLSVAKTNGLLTFCQPPSELTLEIANTRAPVNEVTDRANRARTIGFTLSQGFNPLASLSDFKILSKTGAWVPITPSSVSGTTSLTYTFTTSSIAAITDGVEGLSDIDGNGVFDDLMPGSKMFINVVATINCPAFFSNPKSSGRHTFLEITGNYTTACGQSGSKFESLIYQDNFRSTKLSGPTDIIQGQSATYVFLINREVTYFDLDCQDGSFSSDVTFPSPAYKVTAVRYTFFAGGGYSPLNFTQDPDGTLHILGGGPSNRYEVDVTLDCSLGTVSAPSSILQWNAYFNCAGTCCKRLIGQESYEIFNHCAGTGTGSCLRTKEVTLERTSFGYAEATSGFYMQLPATKLNRTSPGIRLNAAMETDNIQAVAKGEVSSGTFDNAHVEIQYTSPVDANILAFTNGYFTVNTGSGAQNFPITTPPVITNNGRDFFYDFSVQGLTSFPAGTTIDLYASFKILKASTLVPGETAIPKFRAFHFALVGNTRSGCESFGVPFTVVKTGFLASTHFFSTSYGCTTPAQARLQFLQSGLNTNVDPFPNEFRPNTRLNEIKIKAPKGMAYQVGGSYFDLITRTTLANPSIVNNADGTSDLTWSSDRLPVFDVRSSNAVVMLFGISPVCLKDIAAPAPIPATIKYTNYEFDEGNAVNLEFTQNHNATRSSLSSLSVQGNITQDAFAQTVTWPLPVCESSGGERRNHTWLTFEPPSNVNLLSATINGVNLEIIQYDPAAPHKRLIKIGQLGGVCKTIMLTAAYTDCKENVTDEINLRAGSNCGEFPTNPDVIVCSSLTPYVQNKLFIRYKNADLAQSVTKINPKSNLCESIPFQVELLSSGIGNMSNVFSLLKLPQGIVYRQGSASYQLPSTGATTWTPLADPVNMTVEGNTGLGWNLSTAVLGGGEFVNQTKILLRFDLEASCSESFESNYDPGVPVITTAIGRTNCGDLVVRNFQSKIEINGMDVSGNALAPNAEIDEICTSGFATKVYVSVTNRGTSPSSAQDLVVTLPPGVLYLGVRAGVPKPASAIRLLGITRITWKLNAGIPVDQTLTGFNFSIAVLDQDLSSIVVQTRTYIFGSGTCTATGEPCSLRATTGQAEVEAPVKKENCYRCQEPVVSMPDPACAGITELTFKAWDEAKVVLTCDNDNLVIANTGNGDMTDSLMYNIYYSNANGVVEDIVIKKFKLAKATSMVVNRQSGTLTISRLEVEQSAFNAGNSGIVASVDMGAGGAYCSNVSYRLVQPAPIEWNFGDDDNTTQGPIVTHTYEWDGDFNVTLMYCGNRSKTVSYTALDCRILDLELGDECSNDPQVYRWSIYNPNQVSVALQYELINSPFHGSFTIPADTDTTFYTPAMAGNKTLRVWWLNERNEVTDETQLYDRDPCFQETCDNCFSSFTLLEGKEYVLSAWIKEETTQGTVSYESAAIALEFTDNVTTKTMKFRASGSIIDGWQRVWTKFVVPDDVAYLTVRLLNEGGNEAYFDDVRIHPFNSNIKSYVYDPGSQRLMAELDENNYATFYEYDEEGALIRVKKETERGVKTIQETRNNNVKVSHGQ